MVWYSHLLKNCPEFVVVHTIKGIGTGFQHSSVGATCNTGDVGSIPGSGKFPGERIGKPLQYSCLENPMDRGAWQVTLLRVATVRHGLVLSF